MLNKNEIQAALNCKGDCYTCELGKYDFSGEEFGCTRKLAETALSLLEATNDANKILTDTKKNDGDFVGVWQRFV